MPASSLIHFSCQFCRTQLSVPPEMAGVTGPCPTCSQQITAPAPTPAQPDAAPAAQGPPSQPLPATQPAPASQSPPAQQAPPPAQTPPQAAAASPEVPQAPSAQPQPPLNPMSPGAAPPTASVPEPPQQVSPPLAQEIPAARQTAPDPEPKSPAPPASEAPRPRRSRRDREAKAQAKVSRRFSPRLLVGIAAAGALLVGGALAAPKLMNMLNSGADVPSTADVNADVGTAPVSPQSSPPTEAPLKSGPPERHLVDNTKPRLNDEIEVGPLEDEPIEEGERLLDPPREFLKNYITSKTWEELIDRSVGGEALREQMGSYYLKHPYQAEELIEISFQHKQKLPDSDFQFYLFRVVTESNKASFPMTVEETSDGFLTDWVTYVQFKDKHLQKFLDEPKIDRTTGKGKPQSFHVILRRAHDFTGEVPNTEKKWCYKIDAPVDDLLGGYAFVPKHTKYGEELDQKLQWLLSYFPIVELRWETDPDDPSKPYVRLMQIKQFNWRLHDEKAETLETTQASQT